MSLSTDVISRAAYLEGEDDDVQRGRLRLTLYRRTALSRITDKGVRFDQLMPPTGDDTFAQLVHLMRQPGPLAIALCHVAAAAQFEDLIEIFLKVFSGRKVIARFLKAVIEMEVSVTGERTREEPEPSKCWSLTSLALE